MGGAKIRLVSFYCRCAQAIKSRRGNTSNLGYKISVNADKCHRRLGQRERATYAISNVASVPRSTVKLEPPIEAKAEFNRLREARFDKIAVRNYIDGSCAFVDDPEAARAPPGAPTPSFPKVQASGGAGIICPLEFRGRSRFLLRNLPWTLRHSILIHAHPFVDFFCIELIVYLICDRIGCIHAVAVGQVCAGYRQQRPLILYYKKIIAVSMASRNTVGDRGEDILQAKQAHPPQACLTVTLPTLLSSVDALTRQRPSAVCVLAADHSSPLVSPASSPFLVTLRPSSIIVLLKMRRWWSSNGFGDSPPMPPPRGHHTPLRICLSTAWQAWGWSTADARRIRFCVASL